LVEGNSRWRGREPSVSRQRSIGFAAERHENAAENVTPPIRGADRLSGTVTALPFGSALRRDGRIELAA
jgi:hypothetical protein